MDLCLVAIDGNFKARIKSKVKLRTNGCIFEADSDEIITIQNKENIPKGFLSCINDKNQTAILSLSSINLDSDSFNIYMLLYNLLIKDNYYLIKLSLNLLLEKNDKNDEKDDEKDKYITMLKLAFIRRKQLYFLLRELLMNEIKIKETVLRSESPFTIILNNIFLFDCENIRREMIYPLITEILKIRKEITIQKMIKITKSLLNDLDKKIISTSSILKNILCMASCVTDNKSLRNNILNTIFFLRFIIPIIVQPELLFFNKINDKQRKNLIQYGKFLQKISNGIHDCNYDIEKEKNKIDKLHKSINQSWELLYLESVDESLNIFNNFVVSPVNDKNNDNDKNISDIQMIHIMRNIYYFIFNHKTDIFKLISKEETKEGSKTELKTELKTEFKLILNRLKFFDPRPNSWIKLSLDNEENINIYIKRLKDQYDNLF